ncbi:MAG: MobA/MobL family protein [Armatimonadetes bacterium]|nr:MobA/MobL family protein [Armatimonadota bacterium]
MICRQAKDKAGKAIAGKQVSAVARAAYRAGERLRDERIEQTFDYRSRSQEVVHREILANDNAPVWLQAPESKEKRQQLWNEIERVEKRKDSQLAREFVIALPVELSLNQQIEAVKTWCNKEIVSKGFVVDFAVHRSKDGKNPHAHVLCSLRPVDEHGFGLKPSTDGKFYGRGAVGKGAISDLDHWRESWAKAENDALASAGSASRVDHRSLADQGIDRLPEPKIGVSATNMQRLGKLHDPDRVRNARRVRMRNVVLPAIRDVERSGEVRQEGLGKTWRDRAAVALGRLYDRSLEFLNDESSGGDGWRKYVESRRDRNQAGPDMPG